MKARAKLIALITAVFIFLLSSAVPSGTTSLASREFYSDDVGVLTESTKEYITARNRNLVSNCSGATIYVLTVDTVGYQSIAEYAKDRFNELKLGSSSENNGVLLLLAIEDDDYWITCGSGIEDVFPTGTLVQIISKGLEPYFAKKQYDRAVYETVRLLNKELCSHYGVEPNGVGSFSASDSCISCVSCLSCISCVSCLSCSSCGSCGALTLLACGACVGYEFLSSIGGGR